MDFVEEFETDRLMIRSPRWGDGAAINMAIRESIAELRPWMPWAKQQPTIDESEENVRVARLKFLERSDLRLHIFHKETGEFIGGSGLHRINWEAKRFEIGYWIRTSQSGKGFMTEAVEGITNFAIDSLFANRIEIRCDSTNTRSARVAERLGFTLEGILRNETCDVSGSLRNTMIFAKVRGYEF
ncbi:GNAT family N-acetyltransferase [Alicyclobacillus fastidiosus]|uniref:GNAT family N-acetyltransferase n=1 Tax=Alicyclobacillus fastidiosus TaxID=392011 RepID=A0ABY6ZNJ2_9BACL|nr:GNAT family N-acetyltransferase [Alicyclobacillus fastidiosus]WAH44550.1 GNAT family N-acetyltransferase [Alicyclobacillus fastidiosus]